MNDAIKNSPIVENKPLESVGARNLTEMPDFHLEVTWTVLGTSVLTFLLLMGFVLWMRLSSRRKKLVKKEILLPTRHPRKRKRRRH